MAFKTWLDRENARMEFVRVLGAMYQNDRDYVLEMIAAAATENGRHARSARRATGKRAPKRAGRAGAAVQDGPLFQPLVGGSAFEQVQRWMKEKNEWVTFNQILKATALKRNTLGGLIYNSHKSSFEKRPHPDGGRALQFKLKS